MVLPLLKLFTLVLRQAQRPLSKRALTFARANPRFQTFLVKVGRGYNSATQMMQGRTRARINPINEEQALETGSDVTTEFTVLMLGSGIVIGEMKYFARQAAAKEAAKEKWTRDMVDGLRQDLTKVQEEARQTEDTLLQEIVELKKWREEKEEEGKKSKGWRLLG